MYYVFQAIVCIGKGYFYGLSVNQDQNMVPYNNFSRLYIGTPSNQTTYIILEFKKKKKEGACKDGGVVIG